MDNPDIPLLITEGAKKAACLLSCGIVAIAVPGITGGFRTPKNEFNVRIGKRYLIPQMEVFAARGRKIIFCFDNDSKRNTVRNVNIAISQTSKLFIQHGCEPYVIGWGDKKEDIPHMGIDDLLYSYHMSNWDGEGQSPEEKIGELIENALPFETWEGLQLKKLTYEADRKLESRYLGELKIPHDAQFIAIKSPKNTGKTKSTRDYVNHYLQTGEKRVLLITHRIQLSTQTADDLGIAYVSEKDAAAKFTAKYLGVGLCIDSLHPKSQARFNPDDWKNCIVIIDELMQVIWHLLSSSTCQKNRVEILKCLKQLLQNVVKHGGKIICLDADLNDMGIDFIEGLIEFPVKRHLIVNDFKFDEPWKVFNFQDNDPRRLVGFLGDNLKKGKKFLLCTSGQKTKSRWGSIDLEAYFKKLIPDLKILRIDSESVANPKHPAFNCTSNINEVVKEYDLVIATSTIETGVSIEEKHFDGVFGIFQGVSPTDSVRQFLSRYRPAVPRYLWIKNVGMGFVGNKSDNFKALIASQKKLDKANRNRLIDCGFDEDIDGNFTPTALLTWAKIGANINHGMWNYSKQVMEDLEAEGHECQTVAFDAELLVLDENNTSTLPSDSEAEFIKHQIDVNRDEKYQEYREAVAASPDLEDKHFEKLSKQQVRSDEELLQLRKARITRRYEVPVTPDLVLKDDDGWHPRIRLQYYFTVGRHHLPTQDKTSMQSLKHEKDYFVVDSNKKLIGKKIDAFDYLGINRLYQEKQLYKGHPVVVDIFEKCRAALWDMKLVLGIDFSNIKSQIHGIQALLDLLGHQMPFIKKAKTKQGRVRIYGTPLADWEEEEDKDKPKLNDDGEAIPLSDGREEVYQKWIERDLKREEEFKLKEAQRKEQQELEKKQEAMNQPEEQPKPVLKQQPKNCDRSDVDVKLPEEFIKLLSEEAAQKPPVSLSPTEIFQQKLDENVGNPMKLGELLVNCKRACKKNTEMMGIEDTMFDDAVKKSVIPQAQQNYYRECMKQYQQSKREEKQLAAVN